MSDEKPIEPPPPAPYPPPPAPAKPRWRDRVYGFRAVAAVAAASLVVGGFGGAGLGWAAGSTDDGRPGMVRFQGGPGGMPPGGMGQGDGGQRGGPGGPGGLVRPVPPTTAPEEY